MCIYKSQEKWVSAACKKSYLYHLSGGSYTPSYICKGSSDCGCSLFLSLIERGVSRSVGRRNGTEGSGRDKGRLTKRSISRSTTTKVDKLEGKHTGSTWGTAMTDDISDFRIYIHTHYRGDERLSGRAVVDDLIRRPATFVRPAILITASAEVSCNHQSLA